MRLPGPELWKVVLPDRDELGRCDIAAFEHHPVDFLPHLSKALQWANEPMPFDIQVQRPGRCSRHLQGRDVLRPVGGIAWLFVARRSGLKIHCDFPPDSRTLLLFARAALSRAIRTGYPPVPPARVAP